MSVITEYRGYVLEITGRHGVHAFEDFPGGDWFIAEDLAEAETTIDAKRWDQEQDAAFDALHSLDAALATTDAQIKEMVE